MRHIASLVLAATALFAAACTPISRTNETVISPEELRLRAIEGKINELAQRTNVLENKEDVATRDELRSIRGEIERYGNDVNQLERSVRDHDRRFARLDGEKAAIAAAAAVQSQAATPVTATAATAAASASVATAPVPAVLAPSADEETAYLKAFDLLKAGKYEQASSAFRGVIDRYPNGSYSDNSYYWMGESYYVKRNYPGALAAFSNLVQRYPSSAKVADALFKSGLAHSAMGAGDKAKASWQRVIAEYPNANAAALAKQRLEAQR